MVSPLFISISRVQALSLTVSRVKGNIDYGRFTGHQSLFKGSKQRLYITINRILLVRYNTMLRSYPKFHLLPLNHRKLDTTIKDYQYV